MNTCTKCGAQDIESYAHRPECKDCTKAYLKQYYLDNRERILAAANARRRPGVEYALEYLRSHPCVDCGEPDILVLEFDHVESVGGKAPRVFTLAANLDRMKAEIEKCEVRCANCHTRRTREQFGWGRD